jgi:phosphatidylglycerol:prolipoprotein diacylglycerol transferase
MIPFFHFTTIPLGPVNLQVWGLMVALGILAALGVAYLLAKRFDLDGDLFLDLAVWALVSALIFARLAYVVFYNMEGALADPLMVFRVWDGGMSSFGGYLGAAIGTLIFVRRRKFKLRPYAELAAFALPLGYGIGRLGCFFIHDHPGILIDCLLSVRFPTGARLDHGLLLSIVGFAIFAAWLALWKWRGWQPGADRWRYLPTLLIVYGLARFGLDFLRAWDLPSSEPRFLYLLPSQYGGLILAMVGLWLLNLNRKHEK